MSKKQSIEWIPWDPSKVKTQVKRGPHQFTKKLLNWWYCARCGLVTLRNERTRQAMKRECVTVEEA